MSRRANIKAALPMLAIDVAGLLGAGLVAYGLWLIYQPIGFVGAGVLLLAAAWLSARNA